MNNYARCEQALSQINSRRIIFTIMRTFLLFIAIGITTLQANDSYAQTRLDIDVEKVTLKTLLNEIQGKSEYIFFYKDGVLPESEIVTVRKENATLMNILDPVLPRWNLGYKISDRQVTIFALPLAKAPGIEEANVPQGFEISGTILDQEGIPLPGANIVEKGTTTGTQSDFDGNYSLVVSGQNATVVVSYIGFSTKEVAVNGQATLNVTLEESAAALDEIVVVGYGTQRKSDLTGSVTSLSQDDLNPGANASVDQLMLGRAAGVQITQASSCLLYTSPSPRD